MAQMLDTLQRLEEKIDHMAGGPSTGGPSSSPWQTTPAAQSSAQQTPGSASSEGHEQAHLEPRSSDYAKEMPPYFTAPHRTIVWPAIHTHIERFVPQAAARLAQLAEGGTSWLMSREMAQYALRLPAEIRMSVAPAQDGDDDDSPSPSSGVHFTHLTPDRIRSYVQAYFRTFNLMYPILDQALFTNEVLPPLIADGFQYGEAESVLALYVMALGQLAIEAATGAPIDLVDEEPSGICGGTADRPPGLEIFNEGRARVGALVVRGDIASVQVLLLQGTYFEANACHVEYWRSAMEASLICQCLAQDPTRGWRTLGGDLLRRAFWACIIFEDFYHLDLDLPRTSIGDLVDQIRLPMFTEALGQPAIADGDARGQPPAFYFLAKVSLQRVISRIHQTVQNYANRFEQLQNYVGPPLYIVQELNRQLEGWRAQLPMTLQWSDDDLNMSPVENTRIAEAQLPPTGGLTADLESYLSADGVAILVAELRARYYYAKFLLGRPYVFKALHFPETMKEREAEYCASAIEAGCLWSAALAPVRGKKRLLPHLFTWTQSFIAMLSILWISRSNECLRRICAERLDDSKLEGVVMEMMHWLRDVRQMDGIAEWGWQFLQPLFAGVRRVPGGKAAQ